MSNNNNIDLDVNKKKLTIYGYSGLELVAIILGIILAISLIVLQVELNKTVSDVHVMVEGASSRHNEGRLLLLHLENIRNLLHEDTDILLKNKVILYDNFVTSKMGKINTNLDKLDDIAYKFALNN